MDCGIQTEIAEALAVESLGAGSRRSEANEETSANSEGLTLVFSAAGVAHEVLAGPPETPLGQSLTFCGWRFGSGRGDVRLATRAAMPKSHKLLCGKCFTNLRESLKVGRGGGERQVGG